MIRCMRTTIRLDDQLLRDAKRAAAESGRTLTQVIEDALREALTRRARAPMRKSVSLVTVRGQGILPGVDLDDSAALLELMNGADDPA